MSRYVENSFDKKVRRNSKKIKAAGKIVSGLGAITYLAIKSTPKPKVDKNVEASIPGCLIGLGFVILGFVLAFTVASDFFNGFLCVLVLSACGLLFFGFTSKLSNVNKIESRRAKQNLVPEVNLSYHPTQIGDDKVRYALVQEGKRTLFVVGLNPSTADTNKPDPTMQSVLRIAEHNGFDGFIMINLYPYRATQPYDLPENRDESLHERNIQKIRELLEGRSNVEVWLAFGANANRRNYLIPCFNDIVKVFEPYNPKWYYINNLTKDGFPPHPLYQQVNDFKEYPIKKLG